MRDHKTQSPEELIDRLFEGLSGRENQQLAEDTFDRPGRLTFSQLQIRSYFVYGLASGLLLSLLFRLLVSLCLPTFFFCS